MPNDFETCDTGTRNLVVQQGEKIAHQDLLLDVIERRLTNLATGNRSSFDMELYARELQQWIADQRADR